MMKNCDSIFWVSKTFLESTGLILAKYCKIKPWIHAVLDSTCQGVFSAVLAFRYVESNMGQHVESLPTRYLPPSSIRLLYFQMNKSNISRFGFSSKSKCIFDPWIHASTYSLFHFVGTWVLEVFDILAAIHRKMEEHPSLPSSKLSSKLWWVYWCERTLSKGKRILEW